MASISPCSPPPLSVAEFLLALQSDPALHSLLAAAQVNDVPLSVAAIQRLSSETLNQRIASCRNYSLLMMTW